RLLAVNAFASWVFPGNGSEIWSNSPLVSQTNWWECPVVLCLPEYSSGASAQDQDGHSDPSTTPTRPSISSSRLGTNSSRASAITDSKALIVREMVDWSTNNNSPITSSETFVRKYVNTTFTACRRVNSFGRPRPVSHTIRSSTRATSSSN